MYTSSSYVTDISMHLYARESEAARQRFLLFLCTIIVIRYLSQRLKGHPAPLIRVALNDTSTTG